MSKSLYRKLMGATVAAAMFGASAASAATVAPSSPTLSPVVALSLFASSQSRAALCGVAVAGATAAGQAAPVQGCVLPAVDAPVPVAAAPAPVAVAGPSFFGSPLLFGLGAIALGLGLYALLHDNNNNNNAPISPA